MLDKCFYYSANPVHIQLAKKKIIDAKRREEKIKEKRDAKMEIARPIGEILGDGDAFDSDGDAYQSSQIAQELAGRLTTRQLRLLSGWLAAKGN